MLKMELCFVSDFKEISKDFDHGGKGENRGKKVQKWKSAQSRQKEGLQCVMWHRRENMENKYNPQRKLEKKI